MGSRILVCVWMVLVLGCAGAPALHEPKNPDDRVPIGYLSADFALEKHLQLEAQCVTNFEGVVVNCARPFDRSVDIIEGVGGAILVLMPDFTEPVDVALRGEDANGHSKTFAVARVHDGRAMFYPEMWEGKYASEMHPTSVVLLFINEDAEDREDAVRGWKTFAFRTREGNPQQPF